MNPTYIASDRSSIWSLACQLIGLLICSASLAHSQPVSLSGQPSLTSTCADDFIIYAPLSTRRFLLNDPVNQRTRVNLWRDLLRERGASYRILTNPNQLVAATSKSHLILPSAYVITELERNLLDKRRTEGCGLLLTGIPASRNSDGSNTDLAWAQSILGPLHSQSDFESSGEFVLITGNTPLTYGIVPGTRLWVGKAAAKEIVPGFQHARAAYVSDWAGIHNQGGALLFSDQGKGRHAYIGWPESVWTDKVAEFREIAGRALDWIEGIPAAYISQWPWPYSAAMSVGINVTQNYENLDSALKLLQKHKTTATFNLLAADLERLPSLSSSITAPGHELSTLGDQWRIFVGQPQLEQSQRVTSAAKALARTTKNSTAFGGMRTPEGLSDESTELAVIQAGGHYLVDAGRIDSALPVIRQDNRLVLLPNPISVGNGSADGNESRDWGLALEAQLNRVLRTGGYSYVGLDLSDFKIDGHSGAFVDKFLASANSSGKLWVDSASHISQWWMEYQRLRLSRERHGDVLDVFIEVLPGLPITRTVAIAVVPPKFQSTLTLDTALDVLQILNGDDGLITLRIKGLKAGKHKIKVRFK